MKLHDLKPSPGSNKKSKRVGRGEGSGKGKTCGRGTKGTKARNKVPAFFEGGQMPLIRRVPKLKGFTPPRSRDYGAVNLSQIASLDSAEVGPEQMRAAGVVRKRDKLVKVLGGGEIDKAVNVKAHAFSESAKSKIEAAGGSIEMIDVTYSDVHRGSKERS